MLMKIKNMGIKSIEARRFIKDFSRPMNIRIDHNSSITLFSILTIITNPNLIPDGP